MSATWQVPEKRSGMRKCQMLSNVQVNRLNERAVKKRFINPSALLFCGHFSEKFASCLISCIYVLALPMHSNTRGWQKAPGQHRAVIGLQGPEPMGKQSELSACSSDAAGDEAVSCDTPALQSDGKGQYGVSFSLPFARSTSLSAW